ncbi:hypothetical protein HN958_04245 [Candidatus Falkowbacteria bacterium]|nr:hypothetical protein [Candidatus Falkowbacteria bacterium]MBT7007687.1 hypothetical protein [Candidatus Falkowbacteria bacterium]
MVVIGMTDSEVIVHDPGRTAGQFNRYDLDTFVNSWRTASNCASLFVEEQVVTWHPDGALISSVNESDVYVLIDGKKNLIDSDQVFEAHDFPRDMVIEVSDLELSCYDDGFIVDWQPVRELFQVEDGTILLYEKASHDSSHCALYEFSSEFAYRSWTIDERLQVLTDQQAEDQYFWRCDLMDTLYVRDGTLVKPNYPISGFGRGVVFVASGNGRLRAFSTEQAYNEMGYADKYLYHANQNELEGSFRLFDPDITMEMAHRCLNSYYITGGSYDENEMDMDNDGYTVNKGDCDDADPLMHPGATESCNGLDDNCNSFTDEGKLCPDGATCLGLAGCYYQETFTDQDLVEPEPEPEELEDEIEPEQDPCQGVSHCLSCRTEQDCYAFDSCDGNNQVSFSGYCLYEGYCHREIIPCQFGCLNGVCNTPQQPDQDQIEDEPEAEMEPDSPEEQDNCPSMDDLVTCTFTCPADMQAYAWYASFGEAIGSPSVTVNSPLRDICLRGQPWIDFNCACLYPSLWSCYDHTVATIECNLPFDRRAGGNGEGEIWFPGIQCW